MKLGKDASVQQLGVVAVAGVMIFLSVIDAIKGPSDSSDKKVKVVARDGSKYLNPRLSWYEKVFCRGYQRSLNCGFNFYHPLRGKLEAQGKRIVEKEAPNGVVVYRGYLKGDRDDEGKIEFDPDF